MKIGLIGYGKMGKAIEKIALEQKHEVVCVVENKDQLPRLAESSPDVVIEFTRPESAVSNLTFCIEHRFPVITGTTGWLENYEEISALCTKHDGTFLHSSNFSIGVNLFFELNEWLTQKMKGKNFECSIEEIHHTEKQDSPSGTAITLAEGIQRHNPSLEGWINEESADHTKLEIISKRIPNVPGTHTVFYKSKLETINIEHVAHDRSVFAEGTVAVADWIKDKKGVFTMSDFINEGSTSPNQ